MSMRVCVCLIWNRVELHIRNEEVQNSKQISWMLRWSAYKTKSTTVGAWDHRWPGKGAEKNEVLEIPRGIQANCTWIMKAETLCWCLGFRINHNLVSVQGKIIVYHDIHKCTQQKNSQKRQKTDSWVSSLPGNQSQKGSSPGWCWVSLGIRWSCFSLHCGPSVKW